MALASWKIDCSPGFRHGHSICCVRPGCPYSPSINLAGTLPRRVSRPPGLVPNISKRPPRGAAPNPEQLRSWTTTMRPALRENLADYDVAVIGGGPGGLPAAIASARAGARSVLVEWAGVLDGDGGESIGIIHFIDWYLESA